MIILQNAFVKIIVVPILFALAAALLESAASLVRGTVKGERKFRIWISQKQQDGSSIISPMLNQPLAEIRKRNDIVDIDRMVSFDIADFASLGLDLVVLAFAVDVASLIGIQGESTMTGYVLIVHVFALVGIMVFVMLNQLAGPEQQKEKRIRATIAIGLGLIAMMISFLAL